MSDEITITSTTDTEDEIRAALGEPEAEAASEQPGAADEKAASEHPNPSEAAVSEEETEEQQAAAKETGATEEPEPQQEEEEQQAAPAQKPKRTKRDKRIDKLTREKYELQHQLEIAQLNASQPKAKTEERPSQPGEKPQPSNFEDYEQYVDALTDWKMDQRLQKEREKEARAYSERAEQERAYAWQQRQSEARQRYEDYDEVVMSEVPVSPAMGEAIVASPFGPDMLYWLGQNPKHCAGIAALSPLEAIMELGKLEAHFAAAASDEEPEQEAAKSPPARKPVVSKAPKPISPVTAKGGKAVKNPDEMTQSEYRAWYRENFPESPIAV